MDSSTTEENDENDRQIRLAAAHLIASAIRPPSPDIGLLSSAIDPFNPQQTPADSQMRMRFASLPPSPPPRWYPLEGAPIPAFVDAPDTHLDMYSYQPLQSQTSIRLLELLVSPNEISGSDQSDDEEIRFSLRIVDLAEDPIYDALSYTWGCPFMVYADEDEIPDAQDSAERCCPVMCDGSVVMVTRNLYDALHRLLNSVDSAPFAQLSGRPRSKYLWIDAICVDQSNVLERNAQVALMSHIYSQAQTVLIWLGEADPFMDGALLAMRRLATIPLEEARDLVTCNILHGNLFRERGISDIQRYWESLYAFLQRTWFRRAWIVQEVTLARCAIVMCGGRVFDWRYLVHICLFLSQTGWDKQIEKLAKSDMECRGFGSVLNRIHEGQDRMQFRDPQSRRRLYQSRYDILVLPVEIVLGITNIRARLGRDDGLEAYNQDWPLTIMEMLRKNRSSHSTDPRDKVYAFLCISPGPKSQAENQTEMEKLSALQELVIKATMSGDTRLQMKVYRDFAYALSGESQQIDPIKPDYRKSTREVFIEAAKFMICSSQSLELLSHIQDQSVSQIPDLPAWVPDYSVECSPEAFSGGEMVNWLAAGTLSLNHPLKFSGEFLHTSGVLLDTIIEVAVLAGDPLINAIKVALGLPKIYRSDLDFDDLEPNSHLIIKSLTCREDGSPEVLLPLKSVSKEQAQTVPDEENENLTTSDNAEESFTRVKKLETRVEVLWRTLILDHCEGHPAPLSSGFAFGDWITSRIVEKFVEYTFKQKTPASLHALQAIMKTWHALAADEPGAYMDLEKLQATKADIDATLRSFGRSVEVDLHSGLIRFVHDDRRMGAAGVDFRGASPEAVDHERLNKFKSRYYLYNHRRRVFRTEGGWFGNGPRSLMVGDQVWILPRSDVPVVLRPMPNGRHRVVGVAYVHGVMKGEAIVDENQAQVEVTLE